MKLGKHIFINSLKIITSSVIAIVIALAMNLEFAISAGIVAILTIQPTKKETVKIAVGRLCAFIAAIFIAYVCFALLDFTVGAFFVYMLVYISVCQIFSWNSAMAMNSVLISHFITVGSMDMAAIGNEVFIFLIGVCCGIVANLHLRKRVDYIEKLKRETDEQMIRVLSRMSIRILNKDISDYNGECFDRLRESIREAKNVAEENFNNQFGSADTFDIEYIAMREKQCQILYEMYKAIRNMDTTPHTAKRISEFLEKLAKEFCTDNLSRKLLEDFNEMDMYMKNQPLPLERKEFEDRARLFGLMRSIEELIALKGKQAWAK